MLPEAVLPLYKEYGFVVTSRAEEAFPGSRSVEHTRMARELPKSGSAEHVIDPMKACRDLPNG